MFNEIQTSTRQDNDKTVLTAAQGQSSPIGNSVPSLQREGDEAYAAWCAWWERQQEEDLKSPIVNFTIFKKDRGILTKRVYRGADGRVAKDASDCRMTEGVATACTMNFAFFRELLKWVSPDEAVAFGRFVDRKTGQFVDDVVLDWTRTDADAVARNEALAATTKRKVVAMDRLSDEGNEDAIARTRDYFQYTDAPAILMIDHDPSKWAPQLQDRDEFLRVLEEICPAMRTAARIITTSTSSGIRDKATGELVSDSGGMHIYFPVTRGSDIERFGAALFKRLWLANWGYIALARNGAKLVRSIIDGAVFSPERLDFVAGAVVGDGLYQDRPAPKYRPGGYLDTTTLLDLTPDEEREYAAFVDEMKAAIDGESREVFESYVEERADELVRTRGVDRGTAVRTIRASANPESKDLYESFLLDFDCEGVATVRNVLDDPRRFDGKTLADPIEGAAYGRGKAQFYWNNGKPVVHSFAHGGRTYYLHRDLIPIDLEALERNAKVRGAVESVQTGKLPIEDLETMTIAEVERRWPEWMAGRNKKEQADVRRAVNRKTGIPLRELQAQYNDLTAESRKAERDEAYERMVAGRVQIYYDHTRTGELAERALKAVQYRSPSSELLDFGGALVRVASISMPACHAVDDEDAKAPETTVFEGYSARTLHTLIERHVVMYLRDKNDDTIRKPVDLPMLIASKAGDTNVFRGVVPAVSGLVNHPIVTKKGRILNAPGLHADVGIYIAGDYIECRPYTQQEAREAIARVADHYLSGCAFETELDRAGALSYPFTAVLRKAMDIAPGMMPLAHAQGAGKTTLIRKLHWMVTGQELPVMSWNDNSEEMRKAVTSVLMHSPAIMCFDNVPDGWDVRSDILAKILTSPIHQDRLLGANKEIMLPTNTVVAITGNNLSMGDDEAQRFLAVMLSSDQPKRDGDDAIARIVRNRTQIIQDIIGIVSGYLNSGVRMEKRCRFDTWDRMVRQPLLWCGVMDIADLFERSKAQSTGSVGRETLIHALWDRFGPARFTPSEAAEAASVERDIRDGASYVGCKDPTNPRSIGRAIKSCVGRRTSDGLVLDGDRETAGRYYRISRR